MKDRLNVLSIDWDYFINATDKERAMMFPDGGNENMSYTLQSIIWSGRYMYDDLDKIGVDKEAVKMLKKRLKNLSKYHEVKCMVVDSHRYAYEFILDRLEHGRGVNLVNIDFHHDVYSNGEEVDCGNWLEKLISRLEGTDSVYTWVCREDSDSSLSPLFEYSNRLNATTDIDIINEYDWDLVFICRSGMWSPPHLDKNFKKTFDWVLDEWDTLYQKDIFEDRYKEISKLVKQDNKMRELAELNALRTEL